MILEKEGNSQDNGGVPTCKLFHPRGSSLSLALNVDPTPTMLWSVPLDEIHAALIAIGAGEGQHKNKVDRQGINQMKTP